MKSNNVCREDKDEINQHDIVTWLFSRKQSTVVILTRCSLRRAVEPRLTLLMTALWLNLNHIRPRNRSFMRARCLFIVLFNSGLSVECT